MTSAELEKRKRIMKRSIKLGHCVCDPNKDCPCTLFKEKNICECAGEREEIVTGEIKLTEHIRAVGCASKVPKKYLETVIKRLNGYKDSRVLIGNESSDDAGIIETEGASRASVMTVDVFAPSVDDPYTFGMIAAANSLSDVYAMGGEAETALSIVGFPIYTLPEAAMTAMLQGGADKLAEAGIAAIGGHSINDSEVKCGYAILGSIDKNQIISNTGAETGDKLVLTKPIGGGIVLFAKQLEKASTEEVEEVTTAMTTLNRIAGRAMNHFNAHAATDVTGFSLLGHLTEMARGSNKEIEINFKDVPLFSAVERLAKLDAFPGAVERNREASDEYIDYGELTEAEQNILYSPETSGGLLVSLPANSAQAYIEYLKSNGITGTEVGRVLSNSENGIIRLKESKGLKSVKRSTIQPKVNNASAGSCCSKELQVNNSQTTSSCCSAQSTKVKDNELPPAAASVEFSSYMKAVNKDGALKAKGKKLMALALSVSHKCEECVKLNIEAAKKLGASNEEISEAVAMGISFGGASANMFYNQLR